MSASLEKVRQQPSEELVKRILAIKESLFRLNFKKSMGDTSSIRQLRAEKKELAQLKTLLRLRQLGLEQ